jgi:hypothetical protein
MSMPLHNLSCRPNDRIEVVEAVLAFQAMVLRHGTLLLIRLQSRLSSWQNHTEYASFSDLFIRA